MELGRLHGFLTGLSLWVVSCALLGTACMGTIGDPTLGAVDRNTRPALCSGTADPTVAPLARLTAQEYERTLRSIVGDAAVDTIRGPLERLPAEQVEEGGFGRQDQRLSDRHVEVYFEVADALSQRVAEDPALRMSVGNSCSAEVDDTCLAAFVPELLRKTLRRPATADEVTSTLAAAREFTGTEKLQAVVFASLMAPDFIYRFENRGRPTGASLLLTPFELASRLSYHFWGEPPDEQLLAAAETGKLTDEAGYLDEVERLFADPRSEATILGFFREWLHFTPGEFDTSPRLEVLRGQIEVNGLHTEMRVEVEDMLQHYLEGGGNWHDVLLSSSSFARTPRLADIYGAPVWDGVSAPPVFPPGERAGLLTRAAMLASADGSTNPFRRGIFVRRALLCDEVPPPPATLPADALSPPAVSGNATTRELFEDKVRDEPCASCHAQFSAFGFALEAFDGLGRFRTEERLVNDFGEDLGSAPVDAVVIPQVDYGDETPAVDVAALNERIVESAKANNCIARQYFRFSYRRHEDPADECSVEALAAKLEDGGSLRELFKAVALEPAFRLRVLEE